MNCLLEGSHFVLKLHLVCDGVVITMLVVYICEAMLVSILRSLEHILHLMFSSTLLHAYIRTAFYDLAVFTLNL